MSDDTPQPPSADDRELGELRGRLRGRWKAERRAEEREAVREHWLERNLIGAVADAMRRGSRITVHLPGGRTLTGHVTACGRDYALLRQDHQPPREVAVRLADHIGINEGDPYTGPHLFIVIDEARRATTPPRPLAEPPATFQAILHQYDFAQQAEPLREIELGTLFHPQGLICHLRAHAWDHLYVEDRNHHQLLIPATTVTYIAWTAAQPP